MEFAGRIYDSLYWHWMSHCDHTHLLPSFLVISSFIKMFIFTMCMLFVAEYCLHWYREVCLELIEYFVFRVRLLACYLLHFLEMCCALCTCACSIPYTPLSTNGSIWDGNCIGG